MGIDIFRVVANGLWILGLSVILAMGSWSHWVASREGARFREVSKRPRMQHALSMGMILLCAGLAATAQSWWECGLWLLLAAAWMSQIVCGLRRRDVC